MINNEGISPELLYFENIPLTVDAHEEIAKRTGTSRRSR